MDDTARRVTGPDAIAGAAADDDVTRRTSEIRQDIEQTREEMSETIDAIQEKLTPRNIVANATDSVKNATREGVRAMTDRASETAEDAMTYTREAAGGVMDTVRENPIPAALIGIGAAWLLMSRSNARGSSAAWRERRVSDADYDWDDQSARRGRTAGAGTAPYGVTSRYDYTETTNTGILDRVRNNPVPAALAGIGLGWLAFGGTDRNRNEYDDDRAVSYGSGYSYREASPYGSTAGRSGLWTEAGDENLTAGATGSDVTSSVTDAASDVADSASRMASRAQEYASDTAREVRRRGRRAQNQLQRMVQENPLAVGAGALVLGAAVGLAVPETDRENEWMGEARDTVMNRAQDMARNAATQVQNAVGGAVVNAASDALTGKSPQQGS